MIAEGMGPAKRIHRPHIVGFMELARRMLETGGTAAFTLRDLGKRADVSRLARDQRLRRDCVWHIHVVLMEVDGEVE